MAARRRLTDGFTVLERLDLDAMDKDWPIGETRGGLDWAIRDVEAGWKKLEDLNPVEPGPTTNPLSLGGYARAIVNALHHVRSLYEQDPELEEALLAGLRAGKLITDAFWKEHRGDLTRIGTRRRRQHQKAGRISASKRGARTRAAVNAEAETLRDAHPYTRTHSTRWLARTIARKIRRPVSTVRDALAALRRR